ncbi:MAG TPA: tetratricopeptide repeat protein [Polyangia bacterium]|nr:tetratricopeptide repeat protein [Polyangia bacterium]
MDITYEAGFGVGRAARLVGLGTLLVLGFGHAVYADEKTAKPYYQKGIAEYNLGHFTDAIAQFERAYEEDRAPILLFNIAQSHRQAGNTEKAIFFYRRYLEEKPNAANRSDIEKRIADLDDVLKRQAAVKTQPPPEVQVPEGQPTAQSVAVEPSSPAATAVVIVPPSPAPEAPQRGLRVAGIVTASVGMAGVVAGVVFSAKVRSASNDVTDAKTFDPAEQSSGKTAATLQWVCYGAGIAAIVTGAVLYHLGRHETSESETGGASASLLPVFGPGQMVGAIGRIRF